ncbi:hypothetical protein [Hydrogenothermus marinus]|uniref:Uncharacterized protein n=1 Tax=Hydrogenothermus marinus TaxID=133270 RepID=A0A3M0BI19_9AQUI|nr:hypothetical protein [Hydrogenothermus marinus]RMA97010.1 hypothetical protein CLV39_0662 [Hydrogenothermus marinus]
MKRIILLILALMNISWALDETDLNIFTGTVQKIKDHILLVKVHKCPEKGVKLKVEKLPPNIEEGKDILFLTDRSLCFSTNNKEPFIVKEIRIWRNGK